MSEHLAYALVSLMARHASDTSSDADRIQVAVLRRLGESRRGEIALSMSDDARRIARDRLIADSPDLGSREQVRALVALFYGDELAQKIFSKVEP